MKYFKHLCVFILTLVEYNIKIDRHNSITVKPVHNVNNPQAFLNECFKDRGSLHKAFVSGKFGGHEKCLDNPEIRFMEGQIMEV